MKEIVVISGKGGTGKTSISASFSLLGGEEVITADCDVDAADLHLLLAPDFAHAEDFHSGLLARIDPARCDECGICAEVCRFDAVHMVDGHHHIRELDCEGCGYCARVCPQRAILLQERRVGQWYRSRLRTGGTMVHARLDIGAENSGKLVAKVKQEAREAAREQGREWILVDGAPGIGCPVMSSLSGADAVVFVTEPTVSGFHDLRRVHDLVRRFDMTTACIVNKADLNPEMTRHVHAFLQEAGIRHLADLPYDEAFTEAMVEGCTVVEKQGSPLARALEESWTRLRTLLETERTGDHP
ncbi:ATP-binding protein [Ectothiorhodospira mobilis]|uniref:ATP-binding protein n=1 Tax=Ectothiorhodospira mobilis TaxID=195064 RepID=UPI001907D2A3|nr:ATP-binding protein [Ectothiorhodospira mobilis]MBK1691024.1 (4Fe-4S)-binding protein [Ectothiorhodospira mobilis]